MKLEILTITYILQFGPIKHNSLTGDGSVMVLFSNYATNLQGKYKKRNTEDKMHFARIFAWRTLSGDKALLGEDIFLKFWFILSQRCGSHVSMPLFVCVDFIFRRYWTAVNKAKGWQKIIMFTGHCRDSKESAWHKAVSSCRVLVWTQQLQRRHQRFLFWQKSCSLCQCSGILSHRRITLWPS